MLCDAPVHTLKDAEQCIIFVWVDVGHSVCRTLFLLSIVLCSTHQLPNFRPNTEEPLKHSLMDPFNWMHRPAQTLSFMMFQKC